MKLMHAAGWLGLVLMGAVAMSSCLPKDSDEDDSASNYGETGWYSYADSGWNNNRTVGPISGMAGVAIEDLCTVLWDFTGTPSGGAMDLVWSADLRINPSATCGEDTSGTLEVENYAMYFNNDYWGPASYSGGSVSWSTLAYVTGAGGYQYYYYGYGSYSSY